MMNDHDQEERFIPYSSTTEECLIYDGICTTRITITRKGERLAEYEHAFKDGDILEVRSYSAHYTEVK